MHVNSIEHCYLKNILPYIFIILMVISILSFQIIHPFFINGLDSFFHMSIAYDTYRQFNSGHFSYFLSEFGFYHSLRIVNAVYGPLGGYLSGFLLWMTGSWIRWEIATFFVTFTIAGISMYQLCRYWKVSRVDSVLVSYLYMFSSSVMSLWLNMEYDGMGAAFIPWVLYFGSLILNHEDFKSWKLILLLVILAEIHVFSLLLSLLALGLCFIMSLAINHDRKARVIKVIKVLGWTAALSFNVWGGIIEVIGSDHGQIIPTYSYSNMFKSPMGSVFYNRNLPPSQNLLLLGLSMTILLLIIVVLYLFAFKHLNVRTHFVMVILGLGFLLLASRLFPWPALQKIFPILNTGLQFPERFLPVTSAALLLMLGILVTKLQQHHNHVFIGMIVTFVLGMFVIHAWQNTYVKSQLLSHEQSTAEYYDNSRSVNDLHNSTGDMWMGKRTPHQLQNSLHGNNLGRYFQIVTKTTPDYLPSNQVIKNDAQYHKLNPYGQYLNQVVKNKLKYHHRYLHHAMQISFNRRSPHRITLPFVKYRRTLVTINGRKLKRPQITSVGALNVRPRVGRNVMTFRYSPSKWYVVLMGLSLLLWLVFLLNGALKMMDFLKIKI